MAWSFDPRSWAIGAFMLGSYTDNNHYGSVFPRIGFAVTASEVKASVLTTFKAAHFITRENQLHVYQSIHQNSQDGIWPVNDLDQDDVDTGLFQQVYPYQDDSCVSFPLGRTPNSARAGSSGSTVWNFWRKVKCCKKRGQILLFHTG